MFRSYLKLIFLALFFLVFSPANASSVLSSDQASWLEKHNKTLIVRPERNYPPFSFVSSSPNSRPKGLAVDYLDMVARKIGAQSTYLDAKSRSTILSEIKSGKEGLVLSLTENNENSDYMYFSEPYVSLPAIIVTRKDYKRGSKELSLADFNAKQVAITDGYAVMDYVSSNYPKVIVEQVSDDEVGLQKLLLGEVDAAVMDLASLSYYTSRDVLSYVTIAGQTGYEYKMSFAVPKSMPDLVNILNAGLKEITPSEHSVIAGRWVTFQNTSIDSKTKLFSFVGTPLWMVISILAIIIITILLTTMIIHNRRHHRLYIASLEKKHRLENLTDQLHKLEDASMILDENMQEIKSLERSIQDKIEKIDS